MKLNKLATIFAGGAILLAVGCSKTEPVDETHEGTLEEGDSVFDADNSFYDEYTVKLKEGWQIQATMESSEFDTTLIFFAPERGNPLQQNDDCSHPTIEVASDTDSCVDFTATADGTYILAANGFNADETGDYELRIITSDGAAEDEEE